jgi:hypothetical protein
MLTVGEVHTGLLQHATALSPAHCARILSLREGEAVLHSERPTAYAVSPDVLTGVDCRLPSDTGRQVRGAGTVVSRTIITGGRILQGSSHTKISTGQDNRRLPWSHYLALPGHIEAVGRVDWADVSRGFVTGKAWPSSLNIGAVSARSMDTVQQSTHLDRRPPIRTARTCLRWVIRVADGDQSMADGLFTVQSATLRTLELVVDQADVQHAIELCEDLALHDWLLTTLAALLELTLTSPRPAAEKVARLRPVIEHLLHLWMPGARVSDGVLPVWEDIEKRPGFTRQWNASVNWIRDQVAIGTMALLQAVTVEGASI